ncbi:peptidase inhibitor 16-like [Pithys albifrons albifrons]|uniref:peptidase inhibitor 16-like n=1 Tax=Pithys albifrons albifrons TaxID=3385563 RepID=UPI003A5D05B4
MLSSGLPSVLLVLTVLQLSWSLSDEEKKIILNEHNRYRSQVSPPARAMMKMTWDTHLEAVAQSDAENCIWENGNGDYGRNVFAVAPTQNLQDAVKGWNEEKKFYSLVTGKCAPGQMCGNYKQLVWADTEHVGCGAKLCEKIRGIEAQNHRLLVCKYSPLGNKDGQMAYGKGPPCSQCPSGTVCKNKLCEEQKNAAGTPRTCSGLLLFLVSSATLVGLLL